MVVPLMAVTVPTRAVREGEEVTVTGVQAAAGVLSSTVTWMGTEGAPPELSLCMAEAVASLLATTAKTEAIAPVWLVIIHNKTVTIHNKTEQLELTGTTAAPVAVKSTALMMTMMMSCICMMMTIAASCRCHLAARHLP